MRDTISRQKNIRYEIWVQCGYCQRWFYLKCEGTTKDKVMQEYTEEMQYVCKKNKVNQEKRIWESKHKTTVIEFKKLKDRYKEIQKEKKEIERKYAGIKELCNLKSINLKLVTKTGHQDKEKRTEKYSKHEITQLSRCYACGPQEHQIKDANTDRNIFVRYSRDDTMDVQELQNIMAEYGKIKSIKAIHHQYGGAENRAMICYETEMESQRSIAEINRYKGDEEQKSIKQIKQQEQQISSRGGHI